MSLSQNWMRSSGSVAAALLVLAAGVGLRVVLAVSRR